MRTILAATVLVAEIGAVALLGGCADQMLSDQRIARNTGYVIGVNGDDLAISGRDTFGTNTHYIARTSDGQEYSCVINGGNIFTGGMVNPPACTVAAQPRATQPRRHGKLRRAAL